MDTLEKKRDWTPVKCENEYTGVKRVLKGNACKPLIYSIPR